MHLPDMLFAVIVPREAPLALAAAEAVAGVGAVEALGRLRCVGVHVAPEIVRAGGGVLAPGPEAWVAGLLAAGSMLGFALLSVSNCGLL